MYLYSESESRTPPPGGVSMEWDWGIAASHSEGGPSPPNPVASVLGTSLVQQRGRPEPFPLGHGQQWGTFRLERKSSVALVGPLRVMSLVSESPRLC